MSAPPCGSRECTTLRSPSRYLFIKSKRGVHICGEQGVLKQIGTLQHSQGIAGLICSCKQGNAIDINLGRFILNYFGAVFIMGIAELVAVL